MTKSSNAFASQGLGSGREGKRNGEEKVEEGKVRVGTGRRSVTCAHSSVRHTCTEHYLYYSHILDLLIVSYRLS